MKLKRRTVMALLSLLVSYRFALTREINDGLLALRFAPFQRAYVLSGPVTFVRPSVPASLPRDADNR